MPQNPQETTWQHLQGIKDGIEALLHHNIQQAKDAKLPENKSEIITFTSSGLIWDDLGYPYAAVYVSAVQNLTVTHLGTTFMIPLVPGFNPLTIPAQAFVTSNTTFSGIVLRTSVEMIAGSNNGLQLAGNTIPDSQAVPTRQGGIQFFQTGTITTSGTATEVITNMTALTSRKQVILYPPNTGTVYWGDSTVTTANGVPLTSAGQPITFNCDPNKIVHFYVLGDGTTGQSVKVVELS